MKTLGDVAEWGSGGTPRRGLAEYFGEGAPWLSIADLNDGVVCEARESLTAAGIANSSAKVVPAGTVLVAMYGSIGKLGVAGREMCTSQAIAFAKPRAELVDRQYLFNYLMAQRPALQARGRGGTQMNIGQGDLKAWPIPLPPLDEQRRIAAILDHADALRAKRRQALAHLDALTTSIFHNMFDGRSDPVQRLDSLVDSDDRMNYGVVQPGDEVADGVPLIRVSNLVGEVVDRRHLKRIAPEIESAYSRSRIRGTEILVSCVGTIGAVSIVSAADIGSNLARAVTRVPISNPTIRAYVAAFLRTVSSQRYFRAELRTVAQPTLNVKQLAATPVPMPPSDLQSQFLTRLQSLNCKRAAVRLAQQLDEGLFVSLQSRAFRGEL